MTSTTATKRDTADDPPEVRPPGFVGRAAELTRLATALTRPPAVVLVEGEAGIGKSRLIREYLASGAASRRRVLLAACPPFRQPCTLGPVVDAARQATDDIRGLRLTGLGGALRPLFPEWADGLPPAPEPLDDASAARHRLYRALSELLDRLTVGLLIMEDAHWADEATVEFLLFLATQQPQRFSLLITWRAEDVPPGSLLRRLSARLPAGTSWERITLGPLDVAATAALVASMLPGGQVSPEFAKFLHANTDGLPLAVEESVRLLRDRRDLRIRGTTWVRRHLDVLAVPTTVRDAVLERTAQLEPQAQAVLRAAAVLAGPSPEPVLRSVSGLTREMDGHALSAALGCGLLAEGVLPHGRGLIAYRHALAARAVYEAIPARQRRDLHARAAQALEEQSPPPVAQLARHFREAGDTEKWCQYADQAADAALAAGDHLTAAAELHDLVVHPGLPADEVVRLACKVPMPALAGCASVADIAQSLRAVLGNDALSASQQAEARLHLGRFLINTGDCSAGIAELERAIPGLAHRPVEAALAMTLLGWPVHGLWSAAEHRRWLDRAAAAATDPTISASDRWKILGNRTTALLMMGDEEGWAAVAGFPQDAANPREAAILAVAWMNTGEDAMYWGRYAQARQALTVANRLAVRYQYPRTRDSVQVYLAHLDWFTGPWDGLAGRTEALLADLTDTESPVRMEAMLIAGLLDVAAGVTGAAEEKLRLVLDEQIRRGIATYIQEPAAALARLRLADGRIDEALALTEAPVKVIAAKGIWIWATDIVPVRVQALALRGDVGQAVKLVTAFARGLGSRETPAPQAALAACRAMLAQARGQYRRAAALFGQAADAWDRLPRPYGALLAQENRAACLLADGHTDAGFALLAEVCRGLSALGAVGDVDRVEDSLRGHGVTLWHGWRGGRRGYGGQLSPRELEVVRLAVNGSSVREIAEELCRSPGTVYTQLRSAKRKLGVSSVTGLWVRAAEKGVIADSDAEHSQ